MENRQNRKENVNLVFLSIPHQPYSQFFDWRESIKRETSVEIYAHVKFTVENTAVTRPVRRIVGIGKDFYIYLRRRATLTNYRC